MIKLYKYQFWKNIIYQDKCIEGITYIQMSEMEEKYARFQRVHI